MSSSRTNSSPKVRTRPSDSRASTNTLRGSSPSTGATSSVSTRSSSLAHHDSCECCACAQPQNRQLKACSGTEELTVRVPCPRATSAKSLPIRTSQATIASTSCKATRRTYSDRLRAGSTNVRQDQLPPCKTTSAPPPCPRPCGNHTPPCRGSCTPVPSKEREKKEEESEEAEVNAEKTVSVSSKSSVSSKVSKEPSEAAVPEQGEEEKEEEEIGDVEKRKSSGLLQREANKAKLKEFEERLAALRSYSRAPDCPCSTIPPDSIHSLSTTDCSCIVETRVVCARNKKRTSCFCEIEARSLKKRRQVLDSESAAVPIALYCNILKFQAGLTPQQVPLYLLHSLGRYNQYLFTDVIRKFDTGMSWKQKLEPELIPLPLALLDHLYAFHAVLFREICTKTGKHYLRDSVAAPLYFLKEIVKFDKLLVTNIHSSMDLNDSYINGEEGDEDNNLPLRDDRIKLLHTLVEQNSTEEDTKLITMPRSTFEVFHDLFEELYAVENNCDCAFEDKTGLPLYVLKVMAEWNKQMWNLYLTTLASVSVRIESPANNDDTPVEIEINFIDEFISFTTQLCTVLSIPAQLWGQKELEVIRIPYYLFKTFVKFDNNTVDYYMPDKLSRARRKTQPKISKNSCECEDDASTSRLSISPSSQMSRSGLDRVVQSRKGLAREKASNDRSFNDKRSVSLVDGCECKDCATSKRDILLEGFGKRETKQVAETCDDFSPTFGQRSVSRRSKSLAPEYASQRSASCMKSKSERRFNGKRSDTLVDECECKEGVPFSKIQSLLRRFENKVRAASLDDSDRTVTPTESDSAYVVSRTTQQKSRTSCSSSGRSVKSQTRVPHANRLSREQDGNNINACKCSENQGTNRRSSYSERSDSQSRRVCFVKQDGCGRSDDEPTNPTSSSVLGCDSGRIESGCPALLSESTTVCGPRCPRSSSACLKLAQSKTSDCECTETVSPGRKRYIDSLLNRVAASPFEEDSCNCPKEKHDKKKCRQAQRVTGHNSRGNSPAGQDEKYERVDKISGGWDTHFDRWLEMVKLQPGKYKSKSPARVSPCPDKQTRSETLQERNSCRGQKKSRETNSSSSASEILRKQTSNSLSSIPVNNSTNKVVVPFTCSSKSDNPCIDVCDETKLARTSRKGRWREENVDAIDSENIPRKTNDSHRKDFKSEDVDNILSYYPTTSVTKQSDARSGAPHKKQCQAKSVGKCSPPRSCCKQSSSRTGNKCSPSAGCVDLTSRSNNSIASYNIENTPLLPATERRTCPGICTPSVCSKESEGFKVTSRTSGCKPRSPKQCYGSPSHKGCKTQSCKTPSHKLICQPCSPETTGMCQAKTSMGCVSSQGSVEEERTCQCCPSDKNYPQDTCIGKDGLSTRNCSVRQILKHADNSSEEDKTVTQQQLGDSIIDKCKCTVETSKQKMAEEIRKCVCNGLTRKIKEGEYGECEGVPCSLHKILSSPMCQGNVSASCINRNAKSPSTPHVTMAKGSCCGAGESRRKSKERNCHCCPGNVTEIKSDELRCCADEESCCGNCKTSCKQIKSKQFMDICNGSEQKAGVASVTKIKGSCASDCTKRVMFSGQSSPGRKITRIFPDSKCSCMASPAPSKVLSKTDWKTEACTCDISPSQQLYKEKNYTICEENNYSVCEEKIMVKESVSRRTQTPKSFPSQEVGRYDMLQGKEDPHLETTALGTSAAMVLEDLPWKDCCRCKPYNDIDKIMPEIQVINANSTRKFEKSLKPAWSCFCSGDSETKTRNKKVQTVPMQDTECFPLRTEQTQTHETDKRTETLFSRKHPLVSRPVQAYHCVVENSNANPLSQIRKQAASVPAASGRPPRPSKEKTVATQSTQINALSEQQPPEVLPAVSDSVQDRDEKVYYSRISTSAVRCTSDIFQSAPGSRENKIAVEGSEDKEKFLQYHPEPLLQKAFFALPLRSGTIIVAWLSLVASFVLTSSKVIMLDTWYDFFIYLQITTNILLMLGSVMEKSELLVPWLLGTACSLCCCCIYFTDTLLADRKHPLYESLACAFGAEAFALYCILVVFSFYQELQYESGPAKKNSRLKPQK